MLARRVMAHAPFPDDVGFSWMEVAARGIDAKRPARISVLLPGGEPHRAAEKLADRMQVDRPAWRRAVVERLVRRVARDGLARQIDQRGAREAAKRVRLRSP